MASSIGRLVGVLLVSSLVGGCVTAAPERSPTPAERKRNDGLARPLFAELISRHRKYGITNLLSGRRQYVNAQVSGPAVENELTGPIKVICAKVLIKNAIFGIDRQVDLSATVVDGPSRLRLAMLPNEDMLGPRCKGPYVPFPELEALSRPAS